MRFRTLIEGIRVAINVNTDDVADAVRIASRMRSELEVVGESAERNPSIRARELLDKGDLFRSEYLKTACRMLGNAIIDDNAARAMVDFDDAQYQRERGTERTVYLVQCLDDVKPYPCLTTTTEAMARRYVEDRFRTVGRPFLWSEQPAREALAQAYATDTETQCHLVFYIHKIVQVGI